MDKIEQEIHPIKARCKVIDNSNKLSPMKLRVNLITAAKKMNMDVLIIGDADDMFSEDRVESVIRTFEAEPSADFVYNDLCLLDRTRVMPDLPENVSDIKDIAEYNFLGLSNTAIRVSSLSNSFIQSLEECNTFAFDWYLHSRLLISGHIGIRAADTCTLYRIHAHNYAGIPTATDEALKKEIEVKMKHYRLLRKYNPLFMKLSDSYENGRIEGVDDTHSYHYWWGLTRAIG